MLIPLVSLSSNQWSKMCHSLQMRVADEVRDKERANPLGAAVRLDIAVEVGA